MASNIKKKRPDSRSKSLSIKRFLVVFGIALLPLIGYVLGRLHQERLTNLLSEKENPVQISNNEGYSDSETLGSFKYDMHLRCDLYGKIEKDSYLATYTVRAGDTLLSIAKKQLGSTDKVAVLVALNKERYSTLSIEKPFVEIGWKLFLPPKDPPNISGDIAAYAGEVAQITSKGSMTIKSTSGTSYVHTESSVDYPDRDLKVGDCAVVLSENIGGSWRTKQVRLQDTFPFE